MKIIKCESYTTMSEVASKVVLKEIEINRNLVICAATGNSPIGLYQNLAKHHQSDADFFRNTTFIQLDEWGGLEPSNEKTCQNALKRQLLGPLNIKNFISIDSNPESPEKEIENLVNKLNAVENFDLCILGIGKNGHLGFNEPSETLQTKPHIATLHESTKKHKMIENVEESKLYGITLGFEHIFKFKKILLLITGDGKNKITQNLLGETLNTQNPASMLHLHPNVTCLIDCGTIKI